MNSKRFVWPVRPLAEKDNMVCGEKYRFTVLTSRLIRFEYSQDGIFEDRASQSVFYRDFPVCGYTSAVNNGVLTLETDDLIVSYCENELFSRDTLKIRLKNEPASSWCYGDEFEDLGGTARTLDTINGGLPLGHGVCSKNGFSVIDDSSTMVLNEDGWVDVRHPDTVDFYFFGYGFAYLDAVKDLYRLTGIPPMLPAYALGNWWSRYHAYMQDEYISLIERFKKEDVPFSVSVIDMDWHITEIPEDKKYGGNPEFDRGWTGYSWNKELFPDYKSFLKYLHDRGLKTSLNLHPAAGVCRYEDMYKGMAEACGVDPESGERIPFDILNPDFMEKYFDVLHHPYEENGVDFWWMDWQQGTDYWWIHEPNTDGNLKDKREVLDPLWMLNHLHILDISRDGKRPMFFSRYSGPGSQRYPVGFSGDTHITWKSLNFQPGFTAAASNIGYSWWSHDIGGHMCGYRDEDLTVRWLQLGVFSPINRLHSSNSEFICKEPWRYDEMHSSAIKYLLRLRHELFPYIYTMNYRTHSELEPIIQPMYYAYPKTQTAYEAKNQYFFGSELMAVPITEANAKVDKLGGTDVFLPKGEWFDFFDGSRYYASKNRKMRVYRSIDRMPVFAKAGAIVPMQAHRQGSNTLGNSDELIFMVFPGADNRFTLYEDAGEGSAYANGKFVKTRTELVFGRNTEFTVYPSEGDLSIIPAERIRTVKFRGFGKGAALTAKIDGVEQEVQAEYDESTYTYTASVRCGNDKTIVFELENAVITDNFRRMDRIMDILIRAEVSTRCKDSMWKAVCSDSGIHDKMSMLNNEICSEREEHLVDAIREQLTFVQSEFE